MKRNHAVFVCSALVLISAFAAAFYYGKVPPQMPTHWDINGHANGYMPRLFGVMIWPTILVAISAMLVVLPSISPNNFRLDQSLSAFNLLTVATAGFCFVVNLIALQAATGAEMHIQSLIPALIGILFIVTGNYLGKLRKNFFLGVRTPWTLTSDEVWSRTQRMAGWMFILSGLAMFVEAVIGPRLNVILIIAALVALGPVVYSFVLYKRVEGFSPPTPPDTETNS